MLGQFWDHVGIILGLFWDHFGIILGSCWYHFGIILGSFWDHLGIILVSFRDNIGIILGYFGIRKGFYSREVGVIRFNLHPLINHPPVGPPHSILHDFLLGRPADGHDLRFNLHPFINQHHRLCHSYL